MKIFVPIIAITLLIIAGFFFISQKSNQSTKSPQKTTTSSPKEEGKMVAGYEGNVLAGNTSPLLDFTRADYDKALASGKIVLLYFYANWCPICRAEVPQALYPAFNELSSNGVIGFRVNYNDSDTDESEKALAKEFVITYQHAKVILKNGKAVAKSMETWDKEQYLQEITKALP